MNKFCVHVLYIETWALHVVMITSYSASSQVSSRALVSTCGCAPVGPHQCACVYVACCVVNQNTSSAADAEGSSANAYEKRAGASSIQPPHAAAVAAPQTAAAAATAVRRARSLLRAPAIPAGLSLLPPVLFLPQRRPLPSRYHGLTSPEILYV